jgi:hypothetical protein
VRRTKQRGALCRPTRLALGHATMLYQSAVPVLQYLAAIVASR